MAPYLAPSSPYDTSADEHPLVRTALERVLCQIRYSSLAILIGEQGNETALAFSALVNKDYPIFESSHEGAFVITPEGLQNVQETAFNIWRLRSADEMWQVTLTREFIALDTRSYVSRSDFIARLSAIIDKFITIVQPYAALRVGIRYTNIVKDPDFLADLSTYVKPELVGAGNPILENTTLTYSLSQSAYADPKGGINVNVGTIAPNQIFDVSLSPNPERTWVLDIDSYQTEKLKWNGPDITDAASTRAGLAYQCFRWAVTEDFLARYNGDVHD